MSVQRRFLRLRYFIPLLLLMSLLEACGGGSGLPTCELEDLVQPTDLSPNDLEVPIDSLTPTLSWEYTAGCDPDAFQVDLYMPHWSYPARSWSWVVDGSMRSLTTDPLVPGTSYSWRLTPIRADDSTAGLAAGANFVTGPVCSTADREAYTPPNLLYPFDGQVISALSEGSHGDITWSSPALTFAWENSMTCLPTEGYTVQISLDPTFLHSEVYGFYAPDGSAATPWFFGPDDEWHDCERYYWRVMIGDPSHEDPVFLDQTTSETWSFLINTSGVWCAPDLGPILTPMPWIGIPLEAEPGSSIPWATVLQGANCRSGPSLDYPVLDYLSAGAQLEVHGRNQESSWWYLLSPNLQLPCWVAGGLLDLSGGLEGVPVQQVGSPPVAPTEAPVNCGQYIDTPSCEANPACWWNPNYPPNSYGSCVNK